jgi:sodium-dependent dicarboxylate transporter 2/3/5
MSETVEPIEQLSAMERRFEHLRRRVGFVLAPVAFGVLFFWPMPSLEPAAHRLAAVMGAVIVLWVTESLPMPVTALIGVSACVLLGVAKAKAAFAPFADPLMFLFIGSFILARAIFLHRLDRRLAFGVLSLGWVGGRPSRILFAFGAVTTFMSAWISNTATTAMMFAIGMSILAFLFNHERSGGTAISRRYATGMMLITSFGASIGGLATPIGTPPNVIGLGFIREKLGVEFPFFKWMMLCVPVVTILFSFLFAYMNYFCRAGVSEIAGSHELLERERVALGPWTVGQRSTLAAFLVTVILWIVPGGVALVCGEQSAAYKAMNDRLPEGVAAIAGAFLLFLLPGGAGRRAINWQEAVQIDWGVVLLYGGGFALGTLASQTGLADAVGKGLAAWLPARGDLGLLIAATLVAVLVSESTSNTASATIVVVLAIDIARAAGVDPLEPALGATLGASLGFMLPVSTPCNAIVYGSGYVPLARMIRYGLLLDVVGVVVIVTLVKVLVPLLR